MNNVNGTFSFLFLLLILGNMYCGSVSFCHNSYMFGYANILFRLFLNRKGFHSIKCLNPQIF
jgi:hypothetical protein